MRSSNFLMSFPYKGLTLGGNSRRRYRAAPGGARRPCGQHAEGERQPFQDDGSAFELDQKLDGESRDAGDHQRDATDARNADSLELAPLVGCVDHPHAPGEIAHQRRQEKRKEERQNCQERATSTCPHLGLLVESCESVRFCDGFSVHFRRVSLFERSHVIAGLAFAAMARRCGQAAARVLASEFGAGRQKSRSVCGGVSGSSVGTQRLPPESSKNWLASPLGQASTCAGYLCGRGAPQRQQAIHDSGFRATHGGGDRRFHAEHPAEPNRRDGLVVVLQEKPGTPDAMPELHALASG